MRSDRSAFRPSGFTLVELLLAAALGLLLAGVILRLLAGETAHTASLVRRLQQRRLQQRTLALVQQDLARSVSWQVDPSPDPSWSCSMAGRQPRLVIRSRQGAMPIVYSHGPAPSAIWRGAVLMRCGPAFDLQGRPTQHGSFQHRVVLDAVDVFRVQQAPDQPVLLLEIEQHLPGSDQPLRTSAVG